MIGRTLGHYEIVEQLGTGGMGVVYKAKDIVLDRFVAIKVLPAEATADADRKRRFVQEAKAASALNHPNIVTIHEIASDDGVDYIVMEYVAGQTLDRVIARSGMKLRELLNYATQAADALAKAHAAGILHRDLKPSNLMVTNDGRVKILDFGLAKLTVSSIDSSETTLLADPVRTGDGLVVGTPAYMSPEQAEGKPLDARSDIFSFGAVLYEMATGMRAFRGDSTASTLAAILTSTPVPPSQAVPAVPRELDRIIVRCLRKEPGRRFQFMADLAVELDEIRTESSEEIPAAHAPESRRSWPWIAAAAAALAGIAAGVWAYWPGRVAAAPTTITPLTTYRGIESSPALSPDGTQVAFVWRGEQGDNADIYLKPLDAVTPLRLTSHPLRDSSPVWSPSGREIAFVRLDADDHAAVYVTPPIPGSERKVADVRGLGARAPFNPAANATPTWTPDGKWLVVAEAGGKDDENQLALIGVETGERRVIVSAPVAAVRFNRAAISPSGDAIAYVGCSVAGTTTCDLWLQGLGPDLTPQGAPKRLTQLRGAISGETWMPDGRALIISVTMSQFGFAYLWQVPVAQDEPTRLDWLGSPVHEPNMSQNPHRLVATRDTSDINIWQFDLTAPGGSPAVHPVSSTLPDLDADFSPDGERIAFASARSGRETEIWIAQRNGGGATPLTRGAAGRNRGSPRWSHDGKRIVFDSSSDDGVRRAYVIDAAGGAPRLASDYQANFPIWSGDDQWIYFASNRSGRMEIWRVPSDGGTPEQLTREGGTAPRIADGDTLYYRRGTTLYSRPLAGGAERAIVENMLGISSAYLPVGSEILYVTQSETRGNIVELRAIDLNTRKSREISRFEANNVAGLSVSPDHKVVMLSVFSNSSELILVDNFR